MRLDSVLAVGAVAIAGVALARARQGDTWDVAAALRDTIISPTSGSGARSAGPVAPTDPRPGTDGPSPFRPVQGTATGDTAGRKQSALHSTRFGRVVSGPLPYTPGVTTFVVTLSTTPRVTAPALFLGFDEATRGARWRVTFANGTTREVLLPWDTPPSNPARDGTTRSAIAAALDPRDNVSIPLALFALDAPAGIVRSIGTQLVTSLDDIGRGVRWLAGDRG